MPDPHVLYVVTAVVVLGLVAWVIVVVSRPADQPGPDGKKTPWSPSASDPGIDDDRPR